MNSEHQLSLFDKKIIKNLPLERQKKLYDAWKKLCGKKAIETKFNDFIYFWGNSTENHYKERMSLIK